MYVYCIIIYTLFKRKSDPKQDIPKAGHSWLTSFIDSASFTQANSASNGSEEIGCHSKNSKVKQRIFMNLPKISIDYHKIVYCGAENCIVSNISQEIFETYPFHTSTQHSTRSKPFQGTNSGSKVEPSWPLKSCKSFTWSSNVWCHGVHFGSSSNCRSRNYFDLKVRFYEKRSNDIQKESSWEQIGDWSLGIWSPATEIFHGPSRLVLCLEYDNAILAEKRTPERTNSKSHCN